MAGISDKDFSCLCGLSNETLIATVIKLWEELERVKSPVAVELPDLSEDAPLGQYVVKDGDGVVRGCLDEDKVTLSQVEGLAILFSFDSYSTIQFYLCNDSELLSEWKNGRRVVRSGS
jgi:hypothetical protein